MHDGCRVHIVHRDFAVRDALGRLMTVEGLGVKEHGSVDSFLETVGEEGEGCEIQADRVKTPTDGIPLPRASR